MISEKALLEQARRLADGIMKNTATPGTAHYMAQWDWYQGVALYGLYRYYCCTHSRKTLHYLLQWFDDHIAKGLPQKNVNSMCPLLTLTFLYEETGKKSYLTICREWLDYAMHGLPRTPESGFQHKTIDSENEGQLWDDTLYMTVLFVARMGALLDEKQYIDESVRQFLLHLKYLTELETGLFYHGWGFHGQGHFGKALWGRGNAWYTAGLVDYLDLAPVPGGVRLVLLSALERQAQALRRYQDADGMWHTLINLPESSYPEASASAGFSYGLLKAVRLGYLDASFRSAGERGLAAIWKRIDEKGILQQVSAGTCVGTDLDYYRQIPLSPQPYGQSLALLALLEGLEWTKLQSDRQEEE